MMDHDVTSSSLLLAVRNRGDQAAWQAFERQYRPRIAGWCRRHGASDADIEDVAQSVLMRLLSKLDSYDPAKGRFRSWLAKIATNCWHDLIRERKRQLPPGWDQLSAEFGSVVVETFDAELLESAQAAVRSRVTDQNWHAFIQVSYHDEPAGEVAKRLGISRAAVYQAAYRVREMLKAEITRLESTIQ